MLSLICLYVQLQLQTLQVVMHNDKEQFEGPIISKGKKAIKIDDDDEGNRKKNKKYKKKDVEEDHQPNRDNRSHQSRPMIQERDAKYQQEQIFKEVCEILSSYQPETIRKILIQHNYDKSEAVNELFSMAPDNEEEQFWGKQIQRPQKLQKKPSEGNSSTNNSEAANNIMNEVFDTMLREEINGREFEELFEEIAVMIKEDQRDRGMGVFEINNFVDECNSIKQLLLVGFSEELSNFEDFHFDESSLLVQQTQEFIDQKIKRDVREVKKNQEDFPSLGGRNSKNQKNIIERIQQVEKKKKQEAFLFTPSRNTLPSYARERCNEASIFNVDNKLRTERDLMNLHKEFSDVPILDLKFVYKTLEFDFNTSKEFLIKYYGSKRSNRVYEVRPTFPNIQPPRRIHASRLRKEEVDEELKHLSLEQIRQEIDHLFKLKQALQLTRMKLKSSNQKQEIDRMINQKLPLIRKLAQASRLLVIAQMINKNPLYVDLHGYREEQIDKLLDDVTLMIQDEFQRGNDKIRPRRVRGRLTACLKVMTGKGLHSRGNRSVLKPVVQDWCQLKGLDCEKDEDHVRIFVLLQ